jgi:hypothetical protein
MAITAVFLFGSVAREDHARGSDTDILLVSEGAEPRHVSVGHLSMFLYPWQKLTTDAQNGDLFVCHIVREARPLIDSERRLAQLKSIFKLRSSYQRETIHATDLGWFLVRFGSELNPALLAKRMIWCVRTILIARSAEAGHPIFAPQLLAQQASSNLAQELLIERHTRRADPQLKHRFQRFLVTETKPDVFFSKGTRDDFINRFQITANTVALQTLRQETRSQSTYIY